ncbi:NADH-quinone oxidoreductase subunit C [Streptomyces chromofuscus]|uniref:NADH-quinone oxidoreductase subunit C n=1 Tax=Streptomyces chromofuscus TaxID=42881 RepID=A0A7M2T125_STRCW|nr:NADH-quinone oxidoreductase subunit C [Streptomyces chromofuscus]QOV42357.1 NADH-quinone oxidoreductase subunit C [Streptomyces chromofuscus]GGT27705.1 dehydrogenase [Streptomyces chromofuscus]
MNGTVGWLPAPAEDLFGTEATAEESYELLTVDVPPASWTAALRTARDELGCTYFDWLSAVDEPGTGFRVSAHLVALAPVRRLLMRTTIPHDAPVLASAVEVFAGATWHERETHEMFGVIFEGHPGLDHLLLPETFEGHPLRKDFVLAARVAKAWPGAKEPGESEHGGPKRRQMLPPGVPDPNEWGPLKGQLPPAPARPARGAARPVGDRPARRTRTAAEGSASRPSTAAAGTPAETPSPTSPTGPRRARSVSEGSASQRADASGTAGSAEATAAPADPTGPTASTSPTAPANPTAPAGPAARPRGPRRARSASEGSASQRAEDTAAAGQAGPSATTPPAGPRRARSASEGSASQRAQEPAAEKPTRPTAPRSPDAPWHHARPAFDEPGAKDAKGAAATEAETGEAVADEAAANETATGEPMADETAANEGKRTETEPQRSVPEREGTSTGPDASDVTDSAPDEVTPPTPEDPPGGRQ